LLLAKKPRENFRGAFFRVRLDVIGIQLSFGFAEILLNISLRLLDSSLQVLAFVVRRVAKITAKIALHFLRFSLDLVFRSASVQVFRHITLLLRTPIKGLIAAVAAEARPVLKQAICRTSIQRFAIVGIQIDLFGISSPRIISRKY
jgi:hypothetical protein